MHQFNQLNQGSAYLGMRKQRQRSANMNIIEGFTNPNTPQAYSCCSSDCTPRYGFCPPTPDDLLYEKDDDPSQRLALMSKFNGLLSTYGGLFKTYNEDVINYVANRPNDGGPTGLWGQNVVVPQLDGPAPWGPGNEPPPPPSPACPPNTCVSYKGAKYRTLTGFDPNNPIGAPQDGGCENTSTASIPKGWQIAPANEDSTTVVGLYDWGCDVLILADGQGYNTKNYAANYDNTPPGAPFSPGNIYGTQLNTATPQVGGCSMAILLRVPPPATGLPPGQPPPAGSGGGGGGDGGGDTPTPSNYTTLNAGYCEQAVDERGVLMRTIWDAQECAKAAQSFGYNTDDYQQAAWGDAYPTCSFGSNLGFNTSFVQNRQFFSAAPCSDTYTCFCKNN